MLIRPRTALMLSSLLSLAACGGAPTPAEAPTASAPAPAAAAPAGAAPAASVSAASPGETDVVGLKALVDNGAAVVIDVRSAEEFAGGHVPGARNIPLDQLEARKAELDAQKGAALYLICEKGGRSASATQTLAAAGFVKPINVTGGTAAWRAAGFPIEK